MRTPIGSSRCRMLISTTRTAHLRLLRWRVCRRAHSRVCRHWTAISSATFLQPPHVGSTLRRSICMISIRSSTTSQRESLYTLSSVCTDCAVTFILKLNLAKLINATDADALLKVILLRLIYQRKWQTTNEFLRDCTVHYMYQYYTNIHYSYFVQDV